jgi:hypothetical protein
MVPFLADIEASPRGLLETLFSISGYPRNRHFPRAGHIREQALLATHVPVFPEQKWPLLRGFG